MIVTDFETEAIASRPAYPPKPVSVAVRLADGRKHFWAWGHAEGNNCSIEDARNRLRVLWREKNLFHHAKFDIEVGVQHLGLPTPEHEDSLPLIFLHDPREPTLSLKPVADKYLGMKAREQDRLRAWILKNVKEAKEKNWGAYIAKAPAQLVGPYALGDVDRTYKIHKKMYTHAQKHNMLRAYERELALMPIVMGMEQYGIRIDVRRLKRELPKWKYRLHDTEQAIYRKLGMTFNIGSPQQLAELLTRKKLVTHWEYTEKDNKSTSMKILERTLKDKKLYTLLKRRSVLTKYIGTYAEPWLERNKDEYIFPRINQLRGDYHNEEADTGGAYTGRFSMFDPSFHNIPRVPEDASLPNLRSFIIPDEGCVFLVRDYNQQELRILAHFEEGRLYQAYLKNPHSDAHDLVRQLILETVGIRYERPEVKTTNFGLIYGMGLSKLAAKLMKDPKEARRLRDAVYAAIPGARKLMRHLMNLAAHGQPLRTWGGRLYYCEDPAVVNGAVRTFEYKMLNTLIQGSAADCTKEAMIRIVQACSYGRIVLQVHDELVLCVPRGMEKRSMQDMKDAMESIEFKVPMLSDGKFAPRSWGEAKRYKDPSFPSTHTGR